ncbi:MAG: DUF2726 domain-containing protein [Gammaproteobacteria bacterium]|nr:DUF2726 domain-containing protein [Gammaproteobacteria bacterium]MCW8922573.1 DUF2726 domain-containing protein [Gammaproteobacteria bacterium]
MIWIIIALITIALIFSLFLKLKASSSAQVYSYNKIDSLFTPAERSFLGVLNQAIEDNAFVFGKVRVADVLKPAKGESRKTWQTAFNKINSKHFDFVLCDKGDLSVLCVIELNDKSHNSNKRKDRDGFLASACESAMLPLIQIPAQAAYNIDEVRQTLISHLSANN